MAEGVGMGDPFLPTRPYAARSPQGSPSVPIAPLIQREVRPIEADGFRPRAKRESDAVSVECQRQSDFALKLAV